MSKEEVDAYANKNIWVIEKVLREKNIDLVISNHTVMQPYEVAQARASGTQGTHIMVPHGSALNFSVRRSETLVPYAITGIQDARVVLVSQHARKEFEEFFAAHIKNIQEKTVVVPAGVDVDRFRPVARQNDKQRYLDKVSRSIVNLVRGGRSQEQAIDFWEKVAQRSSLAEVPMLIEETKTSYNYWSPDADIADKLLRLDTENNLIVMYLGKYLWTKGIQLLLAAVPLILKKHPNTYFVIVGFGQFREVLELMVFALASGDQELFRTICLQTQRLFPGAGIDHLHFVSEFLNNLDRAGNSHEYFRSAKSSDLTERVVFTGYVDHDNLASLLPCADLIVAPSIYPESFSTVAVEALSSGVVPVQTHHTGFIDIINVVNEHFSDTFHNLKQLDLDDALVPNLANNIEVFLDYFSRMSDSERQSIRKRCAWLAKQNFSWVSIVDKFLELANVSASEKK